MTEEAVANSRALGGAFDQAWDIGKNELTALVTNDAELRTKRSERIVADFRRCVRNAVEESGLAGVRQADETDVRKQLQAEPNPHLFALDAGLVLAWSAFGRALVAGVAAASHPALEKDDALPLLGEVREAAA